MADSDRTPLARHIRGKRPKFFDDPASDHVLAMVLELSAELWVTRSRLAAVESYLAENGQMPANALEAHTLSTDEQSALEGWRSEFMQRLFRTVEGEAKSG
ncbi:MAG: hypothetical protein AAGA36_07340 [Pseudomonadota bacterium]